jgi:hypothetical protein
MCAMCGCNSQEFMGVTLNAKDSQSIDGVAQTLDTGVTIERNKDSMNNLGVDRNLEVISSQIKG